MERIRVERRRGAAVITLCRPEQMNPLDAGTVRALHGALAELEDEPTIRAVIITGSGRAFSAGGDLEGYLTLYRDGARFRAFLEDFYHLCDGIERSSKIYIAAINGFCVAGGLELMLACDLAIAAAEAKIGDGHLNFGQLPGAGGSQRLPRAIGALRAKSLMLTGRLVDGPEAERLGLVSEVVPGPELMARCAALVEDLGKKSAAGLKGMKYLVNEGLRGSLASGLQLEIAYVHNYACTHPDATEGLLAFKEKRPPRFAS